MTLLHDGLPGRLADPHVADRTGQSMVTWLRDFFGGGPAEGHLLVLDPLGMPWPESFHRLSMDALRAEMLTLDIVGARTSYLAAESVALAGLGRPSYPPHVWGPGPTPGIEDYPILVVGRPAAASETELLARSSLLLADPVGARSAPEIRAAFAGGLPANVLRRCDCVVEVQSPTLLYTHKTRWGAAGTVIEFAPLEPACWNEPLPSR